MLDSVANYTYNGIWKQTRHKLKWLYLEMGVGLKMREVWSYNRDILDAVY